MYPQYHAIKIIYDLKTHEITIGRGQFSRGQFPWHTVTKKIQSRSVGRFQSTNIHPGAQNTIYFLVFEMTI